MPDAKSSILNTEIEHRLVGDIYDAAVNPSLWPSIMKWIGDICSARIAHIVISDRLNPNYQVIHGHNTLDSEQQFTLENNTDRSNYEIAKKLLAHGAEIGVATSCNRLFPSREAFTQAIGEEYIHFLEKMDVKYQMGSIIELTDFRYSILSICRGEDSEPFSDELIEFINRLTPHIRRALEIFRQLTLANHSTNYIYSMFERMDTGVLLLDHNRNQRYANTAAKNQLINHTGLNLNINAGIVPDDHNQWKNLNTLIDNAIYISLREANENEWISPMAIGNAINIEDPVSGKKLTLTITPISQMSGYTDLTMDGISVAIFLSDPESKSALARQLLKRKYNLQERECDICETFLNCMSLEKTAEILHLSSSTVRSYFKVIFAKTGRHSQAELMKLLMGLTINFEHIH